MSAALALIDELVGARIVFIALREVGTQRIRHDDVGSRHTQRTPDISREVGLEIHARHLLDQIAAKCDSVGGIADRASRRPQANQFIGEKIAER